MYAVNEMDFEALTVKKLIDLVFTEMVYRQLEEASQVKQDQVDGSLWTRFWKRIEALDDEEHWINYVLNVLCRC